MSISERAVAASVGTTETPDHERLLSEQWRVAAKIWVEDAAGAKLLDELKTTILAQRKQALIVNDPKLADSHAERIVKADPEWEKYIREMVEAKRVADFSKARMDYIELKFKEWQSLNANERKERFMSTR